ncbi:MAG: glycosyltransferase family 2 protein [Chitinophagaceae bacterium]
MDISIVIPLFNEDESLPELSEWIVRVMQENNYSYEVLFIDDGSTDNSWNVIELIRQQHPEFKAIKFQRNYGKSAALNVGFKAVQGDVVITMDADMQDSPDEIPGLYNQVVIDGYDLVSGWKKVRYDNKLTKNLPSKIFNAVARKVSKIPLHDFNCGLKAYRLNVVKSIEVYGDMHRNIPVLAKWAGFKKIGERVVEHRARKFGVSKFGWDRFIHGFLDLATATFMGKFGKRPMHFFGLWGSVCFFIGFAISFYLIFAKIFSHGMGLTNKPAFYIALTMTILGMQLFLAGFVGELVSRNAVDRNNYLVEKKLGV